MIGKPRAHRPPGKFARLVINTFDSESHYKLIQACAYNGNTLQQFITRAVKMYIADSDIPYAALQHPTLGPMHVTQWLMQEPSIQLVTFIDQAGEPWSNKDLIEYAKAHIDADIVQAPPETEDTLT